MVGVCVGGGGGGGGGCAVYTVEQEPLTKWQQLLSVSEAIYASMAFLYSCNKRFLSSAASAPALI
jgi:hypothetical protein